jgi:transposase
MYKRFRIHTNMSVRSVSESASAASVMRCSGSRSAIKKTLSHPRADEAARTRFQETINAYQAAQQAIIYLDESGFAQDMPRRYGYARRGQRCEGKHDWHAKGRTNVIGAMYQHQLLTLTLFDDYIDSDIFYAWTVHELMPTLPPQAVIVMDNAAFHKRQDTQQALLQAGHTLEYLPPYSPDLNPIEHKWAQAKALRRKLQCTLDTLFNYPTL